MAQSNICIRMDEKLKKQFDFLCSEFGLTMTSAINMFIKTVVREKRIPFEISAYVPNAQTRKAIEDIENGISYSVQYKTGKDVTQMILEGNDED